MKNPMRLDLKHAENLTSGEITPDMIRGVQVTIGEREVPLRYNLRAQMKIEDDLGIDCQELMEKLKAKKKTSELVVEAVRILGNEGLRLAGEQADLTSDWIIDHIRPTMITFYRVAVEAAITASWFMETENPDEERDVTLDEINKKKEKID